MCNTFEYLSHASHIIVIDSGSVTHQGSYKEIEYSDPTLFQMWNKTKHKEEERRKMISIDGCLTTKERHKLKRIISKQDAFRRTPSNVFPLKTRKHLSLSR